MKTLEERSTQELKIVAIFSYVTAAVFLSAATLVLATWNLRWPVVRNCIAMIVIAAAFVFAGVRNQHMARKRESDGVKPPAPSPDGAPESD
jgi:hypothetical protein